MSNASFGKSLKTNGAIGSDKLENILNIYTDINPIWLLTGEGLMLKDAADGLPVPSDPAPPIPAYPTHDKRKGIPLIPIEAMAGYGSGDVQVMDYELDENLYVIPEFQDRGVKYLIRVSESSMYPKYSNGDILACRPVNDTSFFQWGKVYVLDTDQEPLVKRLFQCKENDDYLECHSDNKERYPIFHIPKSSIRKVSIVMGVVRIE